MSIVLQVCQDLFSCHCAAYFKLRDAFFIEIKSILQYATANVGNEAVLRTTDDSIIIEKTLNEKGIPEFKIGGTVT
jgi:hypothetical protein